VLFRGKPPLLRPIWQVWFPSANFRGKSGIFPVIKSTKPAVLAFPKRTSVDTYAPHPLALPGSPSQEAVETDRSAPRRSGWCRFRPAGEAAIGDAGWSSPVARQAHNLKVASSNLAPATNLLFRSIV